MDPHLMEDRVSFMGPLGINSGAYSPADSMLVHQAKDPGFVVQIKSVQLILNQMNYFNFTYPFRIFFCDISLRVQKI